MASDFRGSGGTVGGIPHVSQGQESRGEAGDTAPLPPAHSLDYWRHLAEEQVAVNCTLASLVKKLTDRIFRQSILIATYAQKGKWEPNDT